MGLWSQVRPRSPNRLTLRVTKAETSMACKLVLMALVDAGSRDKAVIVWDIAAAKPIRKLQGHKWQITAVAVMPDGSVASTSLDGCVSD